MSILSLIIALLLEQARPLNLKRFVLCPLRHYAQFFERQFNDGEKRHGAIAWLIAVLLPVSLVIFINAILYRVSPLLILLWHIVILYLTMGFRQFSHYYTDIHFALRMGELDHARTLLGEWRGCLTDHLSANEVARLTIEQALIASHRHVFAVIIWTILLPGPAGAVLYRLADFFSQHWGKSGQGEDDAAARFGDFSLRAFAWIDWLPVRITAIAFAIAGDFEDALYCWRTQAKQWIDQSVGILLATGAGALGVRLGMPIPGEHGEIIDRPALGVGDEADAEFMQSAIGLVWRTLLLCLVLLISLVIARWVGG